MTDRIEPPAPNIPLLRKAVEWAEAEAAKTDGTCLWNQSVWANVSDCGTAYCIAGYVTTVAHPEMELSGTSGHVWPIIDGEHAYWDEVARDDLGLTNREATALFDGANSIADVRLVAEQIAARAGERL